MGIRVRITDRQLVLTLQLSMGGQEFSSTLDQARRKLKHWSIRYCGSSTKPWEPADEHTQNTCWTHAGHLAQPLPDGNQA